MKLNFPNFRICKTSFPLIETSRKTGYTEAAGHLGHNAYSNLKHGTSHAGFYVGDLSMPNRCGISTEDPRHMAYVVRPLPTVASFASHFRILYMVPPGRGNSAMHCPNGSRMTSSSAFSYRSCGRALAAIRSYIVDTNVFSCSSSQPLPTRRIAADDTLCRISAVEASMVLLLLLAVRSTEYLASNQLLQNTACYLIHFGDNPEGHPCVSGATDGWGIQLRFTGEINVHKDWSKVLLAPFPSHFLLPHMGPFSHVQDDGGSTGVVLAS